MFRIIFIITFFSIFSFSCHRAHKGSEDVEAFLSKYKNVKFNGMRDVCITLRSSDISEAVYIVAKWKENQPVYFVRYNFLKGKVTQIDNAKLKEKNLKDYFTPDEIKGYVETIRKYGFYLLAIDSDENVLINPFYSNEPPYFLRLNAIAKDSIIRKGYVYKLYKENWYLNESRNGKETE